ncbi:MAG: hypothetical protein ABH874_00465 [Methanobacteriota archaeon]
MIANDLSMVERTIALILQIGGIAVGVLLVIGYVYHIGRITGNNLKLRKIPPYEFKMQLAAVGMFFLILILIFLLPSFVLFYTSESYILSLNDVILISGLALWGLWLWLLLLTDKVEKRERKEKKALKITLYSFSLIGLLVLVYIYTPNIPLIQYTVLSLISIAFLYLIYRLGMKYGEEEFTKYADFVNVITTYGEEKNLILCQTTNTDYRFKN